MPLPDERITEYWNAVHLQDWPTAWALEHAGRTGEENPFEYYERMKRRWRILRYELGEPAVADGKAIVDLRYQVALPFAGGRYTKWRQERDHWVLAEGQWWHDETVVPPKVSEKSAAQEPAGAVSAQEDESEGRPTGG